jgi:hypothetical protein
MSGRVSIAANVVLSNRRRPPDARTAILCGAIGLTLLTLSCTHATGPARESITASAEQDFRFFREASEFNGVVSWWSYGVGRGEQSAEVKAFAVELIAESDAADHDLTEALDAELPDAVEESAEAARDTIIGAAPEEADAVYLELLAQAHREALPRFIDYLAAGDNPRLISVASKWAPRLERRYQRIEELLSR